MSSRNESRTGGACALVGSALLIAGTYAHPMGADPNDAVAAFTEYAGDHLWIASHLTQLAGVGLIVVALLLLARQIETSSGTAWPRIAAGGAIASLAVASVLQAVDGIALKRTVDAWAASNGAQKDLAFHAAFAVRQIETGLASVLCMMLGLTAVVYGVLLTTQQRYPRSLGALAILGGLATAVGGVVVAFTGFSNLAMTINMPANVLLILWLMGLGICMWRRHEPAA